MEKLLELTFQSTEKKKTIASNAVVLTTGGFGANMQMVTEYKPELNGFVTTNQKGSTGDGIVLAKEIGAATVDMGEIQIHPTVEQSTSTLISESVRGEGAILVNQEGKRFFNEMETRDKVSQAIIGLPEKYAYLILDNALTDRAKAVKFYEKRGLVKTADTVEGLAKEIGVPAENLKATLEAWNKAVADKKIANLVVQLLWITLNNWSIPRNQNRTWYSPYNGWFEN